MNLMIGKNNSVGFDIQWCLLRVESQRALLSRWFLARLIRILNKEAICSSETSFDFQRSTRRYIPEDCTVHNHRCENIRFYNKDMVSTQVTK
jgi:hypothetical protein